MIIELLFSLIFGIVDLLLSLVPTFDFDLQLPDLTFFHEILGLLDYFFPVGTLIAAIVILFNFQNAKFFVKIFNFIIKRIPFIG